ncbi:bidirectional sugar transporter SWEET4 [Physcomitrium patens]|uniref:bidirectional sugar transporter SWEET4 n=1 Tax=Physcomitrium patens TaxID=3218 RepID=UPI00024ADEEB|nr:bidirectional sugar transporter SWEET4-like [Physcomitrium patens]|eukprot:XP_024377763.1 bidirectional sugar transporter SWEET4-like [Physcomitrella patens]
MGHVDFKVILGVLGNITAICLFTSPIPTFIKIVKKKTVADYSGFPYVCTLLNCLLWVVYGLPVVEFQVLVVTINAAGCFIEFLFLTLYLLNAEKKIRMKVMKLLMLVLVSFIAVTVLVLELIEDKKKRKTVIGTLCAVFAVGMYASPLSIMRMVIQTRSVKYMPFLLSLFNFINGLVWFGYAFIGGVDIYIAIPNGLGAASGIAQLALYAFYRNATPRDGDEKGNPTKATNNNFASIELEKNGAQKQSSHVSKSQTNEIV